MFEQNSITLSKGDQIRITRNGFDLNDKRLNNGDILEVTAVTKKENVSLQNSISGVAYSLDKSFGHIAHAHCITSHASQGKNVDEVFISQPAATFPATDAKQFYVSVSRGKESVKIYTDDKESLLSYATEMGERMSALELTDKHQKHQHLNQHVQEPQRPQVKTTFNKTRQKETYEPEL